MLISTITGGGVMIFLRQPQFGRLPSGSRLALIEKSSHYSSGEFQNSLPTPTLDSSKGFVSATVEYLFSKKERLKPMAALPSVKTDLKNLDRDTDLMIWLGHSSYYIHLGGKTILVDPVFSDYAAPVSFANKAFPGANLYSALDFPDLDYLLISHDHWDHLDYPTIMSLKPKIKTIVTGLGVGSHFEHWGFPPEMIREADWNSKLQFESLEIHILPARHFSGRWLRRNKTLWAAFALISEKHKIFLSGDSGYGPHFKEIGETFGGFNLAALDSGQYDDGWPYVHMKPEEAAQAAEDLQAAALLPAHIGKFSIANHSWDDPFIRIAAASEARKYKLLTPLTGEALIIGGSEQAFSKWWEGLP